ncbi:hypothetical protein [Serratia nevei]|uniref:hypothetical protein n=1 Tax=Serratia nevei TaxID=2703794 RepID=UPI00249BDFF5|nr:hypothetical protein [Serratia nevei]MDI3149340.1 hypothetical protein [Serratia nevei]
MNIEPKIYSFDSSLLPDANHKDGFCVDLVRIGDYASLKAERDALAKRVEMLTQDLGNAIRGEQKALRQVNALAVENNRLCKRLNHAEGCFNAAIFEGIHHAIAESSGSSLADIVSRRIVYAFPSIELQTPSTDVALAAIQAQGVEKFADMCREKSKLATTADSCAGWSNCSVHASSFAIRLREAK